MSCEEGRRNDLAPFSPWLFLMPFAYLPHGGAPLLPPSNKTMLKDLVSTPIAINIHYHSFTDLSLENPCAPTPRYLTPFPLFGFQIS